MELLFLADACWRDARTNGAHYYDSKPLSHERLGQVLQSFLQTQQFKG
jgi:hypothetical protein